MANNPNILFKRGMHSALATAPVIDGAFYLTTDSHRLYAGIGDKLVDLNQYIQVVKTAEGATNSLAALKNVQEGDFGKAKVAVFAIANVVAHVIGWVVVAPVLDILIYAEPAKKVFAQGAFAAVSNTITGVVVGGLLILAYTKTIAKKGSLDQE